MPSIRTTVVCLFTALVACLGLPAIGEAQCPTGQFYLDLKGPTPLCTTGTFLPHVSLLSPCAPIAPVPAIAACPAAAGWKRATLRISIPAGCTQANVVVEYEGLPVGWTVNLGDSVSNDGFAGDAGTNAPDNAELWVLNEDLSVANGSSIAAAIDNPLVKDHLALTDGALKFVVRNEFVSWGQPYNSVQTPASKNLFAIPGTGDGRTIYLGLNQVITGRFDRRGCGARRVLVTFK